MIKTGQAPKRRALLLYVILLGFSVAICRLVYVQVVQHDHYDQLAQKQSHRTVPLPAKRGRVIDRHGRVLAESYLSRSLWADPGLITFNQDMELGIERLAEELKMPEAELLKKIASKRRFVWIKRRLDSEAVERIHPIVERLQGVYFREEWSRSYTMGSMLSPVLGLVGSEHQGLTGLEQRYEKALTGKDGQLEQAHDRKGRVLRERVVKQPAQGNDLQLALDMSLQTILFQELLQGFHHCKAKVASGLVMDARTGELLAMATLPAHEPGQTIQRSLLGLQPRMFTDTFEPGSTMKPLVYAAALEQGVTTSKEIVHCGHGKKRFGKRILNDVHGYGELSMEEIIVKSSNIGAAEMGIRLGNSRLHQSLSQLGFGKINHLPMPGEPRGQLRPVSEWNLYSTTSIPMGHEISVNMVQMVKAYAAIANGGTLLQPCLEKRILRADGSLVRERKGINQGRIFRPKTCLTVQRALGQVVQRGTAKRAQSKLYSIGGKTGTTEKIVNGKYVKDKNIGSFIGMAPLENPRLVVMIMMDEPEGVSYGGVVAAPVARKVIENGLQYLQVKPRQNREQL